MGAQKEIIQNLSDDFFKNLRNITNSPEINPDNLERHVAGFVFEELVRADKNICPETETPLGSTLRNIMDDPKAFNIDFEGGRNPDLAMVKTYNGNTTITGVVEAKAGKLDSHAHKQLTGFEVSLMDLLDYLNETDPQYLRNHHLAIVADSRGKIILAKNPQKILAIPYSDDNFHETVDNLLGNDLNRDQKRELQELITNDEEDAGDRYVVKKSSFSKKEIGHITNLLTEKLNLQG